MSNSKYTKRELNRLKVTSQRNQSLKHRAPVTGKKTTQEEMNRQVLDKLSKKAGK